MSLSVNELKSKIFFIFEGQPYEVLETHHLKMQQRRPVVQTRMRNVINGKVLERNFAQSDIFEEADIDKREVKFLYNHRDEYWFSEINDMAKRFKLEKSVIGESYKYLKNNTVLSAIMFNGQITNIELPIKMDFKVIEAPPAIRGDTAQGGVKSVTIETGAMVNVPLFISEGDVVRLNTETGEYVERMEKGK